MLTQIPDRIRRCLLAGAALALVGVVGGARGAEAPPLDPSDLVEVNYIQAAVLGTGTYRLNGRRVSMLRLPLTWQQRPAVPAADGQPKRLGWRWLFPMVIGYDDLGGVQSRSIDELFPEELVTLSIMPGLEITYPRTENWYLKPFLELGGGRDFSSKETYGLIHLGLRSLWQRELGPRWTLRWGNALRWAGEHQFNSGASTGFGILDSGVDVRRVLPWRLDGRRVDAGAYYIYERFLPKMTIGRADDWRGRAVELHEFGMSVGVDAGWKLLGVSLKRLRLGYKKGGKLKGWTIGTEFPF
jgi:hypothetical protein